MPENSRFKYGVTIMTSSGHMTSSGTCLVDSGLPDTSATRHFGHRTLRTRTRHFGTGAEVSQDTSAPGQMGIDTSAPMQKCLGHLGTRSNKDVI